MARSFHKNLGEDPGSWNDIYSIMTKKLVWPMLIIFMLIFHPY